jgi:two-component system, chemotaxis family, chemotaxis protein CheY
MRHLLLIDDDEAMRKLLRIQLESSYQITDTPDPEQGIVLALQKKPDAILLDLMMPRYSGFEICQTLSVLSFTQKIPIFIVSGESIERYERFCRNLGARGFFQKPVDFDMLRRELAAATEGKPAASRAEPRVRIRAALKLCGTDSNGTPFDSIIMTENVTANGFRCGCQTKLQNGAPVDVYLATAGAQFVGQAHVIGIDGTGTAGQSCEFRFTETPLDWVLPQ